MKRNKVATMRRKVALYDDNNIDEAVEFLKGKGFSEKQIDKIVDCDSFTFTDSLKELAKEFICDMGIDDFEDRFNCDIRDFLDYNAMGTHIALYHPNNIIESEEGVVYLY